jgi:hypothetical protein
MADPLAFDEQRVLVSIRQSTTRDLLDRVTAYRAGMEPAAIALIETELRGRGIDVAGIEAHESRVKAEALFGPDGVALRCSFCHQPAVGRGWGWHRLFGLFPVFPRVLSYCQEHDWKRDRGQV